MNQFPTSAREYVQWVYSPHVGVLCGEEAEHTCLQNNLKFVDLLQPFCLLEDDVGVSDPNGSLVTMRGMRVVLQDITHKPPSPALAKKILSQVVTANAVPTVDGDDVSDMVTPWYDKWREAFHQLLHPFDHEFTKHLVACIIVVSSSHGSKAGEQAQRLSQLQHQQQHQHNQQSKYPKWFSPNILKYFLVLHDVSTTPKEVGDAAYQSVSSACGGACCHILSLNSGRPADTPPLPSYWALHTLVHAFVPGYSTNSVGGSECSSSPASPCEDVLLSSPTSGGFQSPPKSPTPPLGEAPGESTPVTQSFPTPEHPLSPTLPPLEDTVGSEEVVVNVGDLFPSASNGGEWGTCLSGGDVDNIRQFVGSFVRGALVPHVERQIRLLTEVVTNRSRSKSLLSATRRWLGGAKNPNMSNSGSSNSVLYSSEATELQTRRLADLAFMFCMYDVAYSAYHAAKNDFKSDQAWLYFAGAQEMAALALFMQNPIDFPKRYLESTWDTLSTVCKATNLGIRLLLLACEILQHNRSYSEAAMYYIKLTSEDSDLLSALMLEQAAACFLKAGQTVSRPGLVAPRPGLRRKFAFHMTLAAHRYSKAGQKLLALRANIFASKVYGSQGLVLAEDHILYSIGKFSGQLKNYGTALSAYTQLIDARPRSLAPSQQTATQQIAYLREFLALYKLVENNRERKEGSPALGGDERRGNIWMLIEGALPELPQLPVPWLQPQNSVLLLDSSSSDRSVNSSSESSSSELSQPASGITLANCLNEEHKETWAGLERLLLEKVFGATARPVTAQLMTPHTNNTRPPHVAVNEPCWLQLPIHNPLLVSFTVREAELMYEFVSEDGAACDGGDSASVEQSVIDVVVMAPGERRDLVFQLCSRKLGKLKVTGVRYQLSLTPEVSSDSIQQHSTVNLPLITGYQKINVKGPRLNNTLKNRSSVLYAPDKRLEINVVPPLPKIYVCFTGLPKSLLCGQISRVSVTIDNTGPLPITGLYLANSDPKHVFFVLDKEHSCGYSSVTSTLLQPDSNSSRNGDIINGSVKHVQRIHLPHVPSSSGPNTLVDGGLLPVGGRLRGSLYIKGQQVAGLQHLLLVFYCHSSHGSEKRYRLLRHQSNINVNSSITLSVRSFSSMAVAPSSQHPVQCHTFNRKHDLGHNSTKSGISHLSSDDCNEDKNSGLSLDTRLPTSRQVVTMTVVHNVANIAVDVTVAEPKEDRLQSFTLTSISSHCARWKLRPFDGDHSSSCICLKSGGSFKTLVQCYSVGNTENAPDFLSLHANKDKNHCLTCGSSEGGSTSNTGQFSSVSFSSDTQLLSDEFQQSNEEFAIRSRVQLLPLHSSAPPVSPVADLAAPPQHPALMQYNKIREATDLAMVLTIHWKASAPSVDGRMNATDEVYGQHSVVLSTIGESVVLSVSGLSSAFNTSALLGPPVAAEDAKPPVRIIPIDPPQLPQIPTKFAASVGLDLSGGGYPGQSLPGGLSVSQATMLVEGGELNITKDLSKEQLENCVKLAADLKQMISHDFGKEALCRVSVVLVIHNTTAVTLTGTVLLNAGCGEATTAQSSAAAVPLQQPQAQQLPLASPLTASASGTLRFVGCVNRLLRLPGHSQSRVSCQAVVTNTGTFTVGGVALAMKTESGVHFDKHVVLVEAVVVVGEENGKCATWMPPL